MRILCADHGPPEGRKYNYVARADPLGYPKTAIMCTRGGDYRCTQPSRVYLNEDEYERYQDGERIFGTPGRGVKVKVEDGARRIK